jgi:hypothetical protein
MHGRAARGNSRLWQGWKVSLGLHAVLGSAILLILWRMPLPNSLPALDTRIPGLDNEFTVTICEVPQPRAKPAPPQVLPKEIIQQAPALAPNQPTATQVRPAETIEPRHDNNNSAPGGSKFRSQESHLPVPRSAKSVVFVLDRSASMGIGTKMEIARREILATVSRMSPTSEFQVVVYNRQAEVLPHKGPMRMLAVAERNLQELANFLSELTSEGGNDHLRGLREAIALQPEVICLLTDADDLTPAQVRTITNWNRGESCIHAVTIGAYPSPEMQQLAKLNRGTCKMIEAK